MNEFNQRINQRMYSLKEIAGILKVSYNHLVNRIVKSGKLEAIDISGGKARPEYRVTQEALDNFISNRSSINPNTLISRQKTIKDAVAELQGIRKSLVVSYLTISPNSILPDDALFFLDVIQDIKKRKGIQGKVPTLDLFLDSLGGSLDAAYKIIRILRQQAKTVRAIIPIYAKSAATAICLGTDEITMTPASELGPVDPIIDDPISGQKIPARSIKFFLSYASDLKKLQKDGIDPKSIEKLEEKLNPYLAGAYFNTINSSKEYLKKLLSDYMFKGSKTEGEIDQLVEYFTEFHASHAYVMDYEEVNQKGLRVRLAKNDEESAIKQLLGFYRKYMNANKLTKLVGNEYWQINSSQIVVAQVS
jgi:hypothetical protein